jgi:hypothetical protein
VLKSMEMDLVIQSVSFDIPPEMGRPAFDLFVKSN